MKLEIIQNFLATQIISPPNFIFLQDNSQILSELNELMIHEILFQVVYYENDLQLRSELEWMKENPAGVYFCIISQKSEVENKLISDYIYRSEYIAVTPQTLLNFSGNYHWSEAANWLKGDDFWRVIDALRRTREHPELKLLNPEEIYLAAALLDHDITRPFDMVSGTLFYYKTMTGIKYRNFQQNYPQLAASVEKKILNDVPELAPFIEQPNLFQQIWLKPTELNRKITPYQSVDDLKHQLAIKAPLFVQDQIHQLEKNHFVTSEEVENYLQERLASDNIEGWIAYLKYENFLTEPLKVVIKRTIHYLIRNPETVDLDRLRQMIQHLNTHHLIRLHQKRKQEPHHPFLAIFELFKNIIDLYLIRKEMIKFLSLQSPDFQILMQELYPREISQIPLLMEVIQKIMQHEKILDEMNFKKIHQQIEQYQRLIHEYYVNWLSSNYKFSSDWLGQGDKMKFLPYNIINHHLNENARPIFFILFDGMRWDGWELLRSIFERIFRNRKVEIHPILLPMPSITAIGRSFLLTGDLTIAADWSAIRQALMLDQLDIFSEFSSVNPDQIAETIIHSKARLKIININLFDQRIHHSTLNLHLNYDEILHEFLDVYAPILEQLPQDSTILISSDHGFIQVSGKWYGPAAGIFKSEQSLQHRRYLELPEIQADKKHFAFFSKERLGLTESTVDGLAFLKQPVVFKIQSTEKCVRYAHGGISLEEQVVPLVIIN